MDLNEIIVLRMAEYAQKNGLRLQINNSGFIQYGYDKEGGQKELRKRKNIFDEIQKAAYFGLMEMGFPESDIEKSDFGVRTTRRSEHQPILATISVTHGHAMTSIKIGD